MSQKRAHLIGFIVAVAALVAVPAVATSIHTIRIEYETDGNKCVVEGSIAANQELVWGDYHKSWFGGNNAGADSPWIEWIARPKRGHQAAPDVEWKIQIKDGEKRQFFGNNTLTLKVDGYEANNDGKKVDKPGPPWGITWNYNITADYTGSGSCADVESDPQVKFQSGGGSSLGVNTLVAVAVLSLIAALWLAWRRS